MVHFIVERMQINRETRPAVILFSTVQPYKEGQVTLLPQILILIFHSLKQTKICCKNYMIIQIVQKIAETLKYQSSFIPQTKVNDIIYSDNADNANI